MYACNPSGPCSSDSKHRHSFPLLNYVNSLFSFCPDPVPLDLTIGSLQLGSSSQWTHWHRQHIDSKVKQQSGRTEAPITSGQPERPMRINFQCVLVGCDSCQFRTSRPDAATNTWVSSCPEFLCSSGPQWWRSLSYQYRGIWRVMKGNVVPPVKADC